MGSEENPDSGWTELLGLEARVNELLRHCQRLQDEVTTLRRRQDSLLAERAALLEKNESARIRVEAMITRLKSLEHP
jgi:cell division protein ZapB